MKEIRYAFFRTLPVFAGYVFLGSAFGIMLVEKTDYNFIGAFLISLTVFSGSMEFVLVDFLASDFGWISMIVMTFLVQSRHLFYGISLIDRFKKTKWAYPYMMFSLTDETYSLFCTTVIPEELNEPRATIFISAFNHLYWLIGSVLGALLGQYLSIDFKGVDFSMTALFVVIFVEQWKSSKTHIPAFIGLTSGLLFAFIVQNNNFILPALALAVSVMILAKAPIEKRLAVEENE